MHHLGLWLIDGLWLHRHAHPLRLTMVLLLLLLLLLLCVEHGRLQRHRQGRRVGGEAPRPHRTRRLLLVLLVLWVLLVDEGARSSGLVMARGRDDVGHQRRHAAPAAA
jgi:hypothetical protein